MSQAASYSEDLLQSATLGGVPCKAVAWVEATRVEVVDRKGTTRVVQGVRTWHGKALVSVANLPGEKWHNRAVEYRGILIDGENQREISGEVFISYMRSSRYPLQDLNASGSTAASEPHSWYVEFTGAGNPNPQKTQQS